MLLCKVPILNAIIDNDDINFQVNVVTSILKDAIDIVAPEVTQMITRPPAPWITSDIKAAILERDRIHNQLKINETPHLRDIYKEKKRDVRLDINESKKEYFHDEYKKSGNDVKRTWKVTKALIPNNKTQKQSCTFENISDKVEEFIDYFSRVGKDAYDATQRSLNDQAPPHLLYEMLGRDEVENKFRPQPVSVETIILVVKDLKETNSVGIDDISLRFVKDSLPIMAFYYTIVVNTSIVTGKYPELWKHPLLAPLYKAGDVDVVGNYRPIALLPVLSKILEKAVAIQLIEHLESNHLISNAQHGFRARLSTETALLRVTDTIYKNIDNSMITLIILCDLSKAFDSVSHEILLSKLNFVSVDSFWFDDYLKNRKQSVRIGKYTSSSRSVEYGVPQGSILGPLLFLIHVNDMSKVNFRCAIVQYADDCQFLIEDKVENINDMIAKADDVLKKLNIILIKMDY